ncbi:hypothetical protein HZB07_03800 [Candidatus Saganbacteria bacterium]|nr:hypothetical protein [Candidatus Saganbacteria bacterium]
MGKTPKIISKTLKFWKGKIQNNQRVLKGKDFPNEYVRKLLHKEQLIFPILRGLYLLKNSKGEDAETLFYQSYWVIIRRIMAPHDLWSIEKESALALYLGEETIPRQIKIRTARKINYIITLSFGLKVQIRPDPDFKEKTRQDWKITDKLVYIDIPEKIIFSIHKRKALSFLSFIKGMKFDKRILEILYADAPKPIIAKELIKIAKTAGRNDLVLALQKIIKENTIYR